MRLYPLVKVANQVVNRAVTPAIGNRVGQFARVATPAIGNRILGRPAVNHVPQPVGPISQLAINGMSKALIPRSFRLMSAIENRPPIKAVEPTLGLLRWSDILDDTHSSKSTFAGLDRLIDARGGTPEQPGLVGNESSDTWGFLPLDLAKIAGAPLSGEQGFVTTSLPVNNQSPNLYAGMTDLLDSGGVQGSPVRAADKFLLGNSLSGTNLSLSYSGLDFDHRPDQSHTLNKQELQRTASLKTSSVSEKPASPQAVDPWQAELAP